MSEFKVGDIVRTKKGGFGKVCQREKPGFEKCKKCGFFLCKPAKIVELHNGFDDCVLEASFTLLCDANRGEQISGGLWRIPWSTRYLEKAFDWVRIK